jgi:hypothetical protein
MRAVVLSYYINKPTGVCNLVDTDCLHASYTFACF